MPNSSLEEVSASLEGGLSPFLARVAVHCLAFAQAQGRGAWVYLEYKPSGFHHLMRREGSPQRILQVLRLSPSQK